MSVLEWVVIILFAINPICIIALIGQPRRPYSQGDAIWSLLVSAFVIWLVLSSS